ncbi:Txe/YoeB family addiction module toxin [Nocardia blacklockiae]|uniref:Txe/YoeB family addiction module toxin n=1 Tax=Nocardia blacklockiae TaxID=480036 RepID=UPI0018936182|nr:Txe/YoeB family addiction module toxin [Nocardia blacklockiae]MBF6172004.1 Txe/YoeB family addiction module toxin [Nocardia blacklockiae]
MSRKVLFSSNGWADYLYWQAEDRAVLRKLNRIIEDIRRNGNADGIGKPEPLRQNLSGLWSRRITKEHRIVYHADESVLTIIACRFHYDD